MYAALRRHLPTLLPAAVIVGTFAAALCYSAEARQVAVEAMGLVFTFFTTPFVLETTVGLVGLGIVLTINHRRLERENDEWVEMEVEVPSKPETGMKKEMEEGG